MMGLSSKVIVYMLSIVWKMIIVSVSMLVCYVFGCCNVSVVISGRLIVSIEIIDEVIYVWCM